MKGTKKIHVICCNDSVKYAVVDDEEKARARLDYLQDLHMEDVGIELCGIPSNWDRYKLERYNSTHNWHIETVEGE